MGVVYHHPGPISLGQFDDIRQVCDITLHAEDAIDDNQFPFVFNSFEGTLKILHIVMSIFLHLSKRETTHINDARMIVFVNDRNIISTEKSADGSQIGLITGGKDKGCLFSKETG